MYIGNKDCNVLNLEFGGWSYGVNYTVDTNISVMIPYQLHEFGIIPLYTNRNHQFSYWPGLSLNPGIWDLHKIQKLFHGSKLNRIASIFNTDSPVFEREFSLRMWFMGAKMSYLGAVIFHHIGDISSYGLNNASARPWDNKVN